MANRASGKTEITSPITPSLPLFVHASWLMARLEREQHARGPFRASLFLSGEHLQKLLRYLRSESLAIGINVIKSKVMLSRHAHTRVEKGTALHQHVARTLGQD